MGWAGLPPGDQSKVRAFHSDSSEPSPPPIPRRERMGTRGSAISCVALGRSRPLSESVFSFATRG